MTTNTEQQQPPAEQKEALQLEAGELQQDIKEAKQEVKQARAEGNDERANRIESAIAKQQADLDEIKQTLKGLADRPFHPAPGDGEAPPAPPAGGEQTEQQQETEPESKPKGKRHWLYGDRWNQD